MATKILLKNRKLDGEVTFNVKFLQEMMENGNDREILESLREAIENRKGFVHDKKWLMSILSWTPEQGMSLLEQARALQMIERLDHVDDSQDSEFEISGKDKRFLIDRLQDKNFKLRTPPVQYIRFLFDFEDQIDEHVITEEDADD